MGTPSGVPLWSVDLQARIDLGEASATKEDARLAVLYTYLTIKIVDQAKPNSGTIEAE